LGDVDALLRLAPGVCEWAEEVFGIRTARQIVEDGVLSEKSFFKGRATAPFAHLRQQWIQYIKRLYTDV
jgi:hypothetical protein